MNVVFLIAAFAGAIAYFLLGLVSLWHTYTWFLLPIHSHSINDCEKTLNFNSFRHFVSGFAYTLLMAIIFGNWANITTIRNGAIAGATLLAIHFKCWFRYVVNHEPVWKVDSGGRCPSGECRHGFLIGVLWLLFLGTRKQHRISTSF